MIPIWYCGKPFKLAGITIIYGMFRKIQMSSI